jgi:hypothetical protein
LIEGTSKLTLDVGHDAVLVNRDTEDLTLAVDTNDTVELLVGCSGEDGLARDTIHVDALASLDLVEVDEAKLGDDTCMATGKSLVASGGKKTSTAFFGNGALGAWWPISTTWS